MATRPMNTIMQSAWSTTESMNLSTSPESALPSSFILNDGTDWSSHIGMVFGNGSRRNSSLDFTMLDAHNDIDSQDVSYDTRSSIEQLGHAAANSYMDQSVDDSITLQDVINSTEEDEFMLPDHSEDWVIDRPHHDPSNGIYSSYGYQPLHTAAMPASVIDTYGRGISVGRELSESLESVESADPCYARLLWKCLLDAPGYTLSLKDIYAWIKQHTQKARDPKNKGWQNSVRHNLSMNAAFEKVNVATSGESKTRSLWRLTESAVKGGVISTTRYRRDPKRKHERRGQPAIKRQLSGAKGGAATRASLQLKRLREARERNHFLPQASQQHYCLPAEHSAGMINVHTGHMMFQSPSPYFQSQSPTVIRGSAMSSPYAQPVDYYGAELVGRGCHQTYEMTALEPDTGLFGNVDLNRSETPSGFTDSTLVTEDSVFDQINNARAD